MNFHSAIRRSFLAAASLLLAASVSAQSRSESQLSIGAKGGVDLSRMFFNPSVPQGMIPGATFSVAVRYIEEKHFGIIAELGFAQRGWKESFDADEPYNYRRTLNYLELPVLAHIYFGSDRARFFINAGPQIGYLLSEYTSCNFNPKYTILLHDFPNTDRQNTQQTMPAKRKLDYGISASIGGEVSINRRNALYLEARFYYGLGNIYRNRRTDPFSASNSMTVSATLGWWFRLK